MEVFIRWSCRCPSPEELCRICDGIGYNERWIPVDYLRHFPNRQFIIRGRRLVSSRTRSGASHRMQLET
jgi:hypothetical protein